MQNEPSILAMCLVNLIIWAPGAIVLLLLGFGLRGIIIGYCVHMITILLGNAHDAR